MDKGMQPASDASSATGITQPSVLVVDDSKFVRTTFRHIINGSVAVREEADGEAAWQALQADDSIVMVFSDIDMPRMNGYRLIERIRKSAEPRIRNLPVVVFSGSDEPNAEARAREVGASEFISKYDDGAQVLARIAERLRSARRPNPSPRDEATADYRHVALMCVRVDSYAEVVHRHGQRVADELINRIEAAIKQMCPPPTHEVARAAGTTFAVMASGTVHADTLAPLRRVQERLANARLNYRGEGLAIRCSFGVASTGADDTRSVDELTALALQRYQSL
jgi:two-component system, cell cycle response regulator